jgi:hypothetical protein
MKKNDLISRAAALEALGECPYNRDDWPEEIQAVDDWKSHKEAIESIPAVDAAPVVWKPIVGYEGKYEISTLAQVRNEHGKILKQGIKRTNGTCYKVVGLCKGGKCHTKYIHRLVAEAFIPNPDCLPFINHKDEDGTNNLIENLEWCTPQYNTTYRDAHKKRGKKLRGILHTEEHKNKISDGLRTYYANNESKSKGRVSEKRKGVILREHLDDPPLYFASVHEADAYLGGGCRANIARAIRRGGVVRGYYAEWADKMDGERRDDDE